MSYMMAGAGSAALAACGGGSEATGDAANTEAVAKAASASGTAVPPAASIIDSSGAIWTLVGGHATRNGLPVGTGSPLAYTTLLYFNGAVHGKNSAGNWYKSGSSPWQSLGTADPRGTAAPSTDGVLQDKSFG
ncbi:hypothetical protein PQR51_30965, partial [Caballeronia grimmiae]